MKIIARKKAWNNKQILLTEKKTLHHEHNDHRKYFPVFVKALHLGMSIFMHTAFIYLDLDFKIVWDYLFYKCVISGPHVMRNKLNTTVRITLKIAQKASMMEFACNEGVHWRLDNLKSFKFSKIFRSLLMNIWC